MIEEFQLHQAKEGLRQRPKTTGYAATPGTGPAGETCKTCRHRVRKYTGSKTFNKCGLVKATCGPGTDIKISAPACGRWEVKG